MSKRILQLVTTTAIDQSEFDDVKYQLMTHRENVAQTKADAEHLTKRLLRLSALRATELGYKPGDRVRLIVSGIEQEVAIAKVEMPNSNYPSWYALFNSNVDLNKHHLNPVYIGHVVHNGRALKPEIRFDVTAIITTQPTGSGDE